MRKYFCYELKKNLRTLTVLTVLCALFVGVVMMNATLFYSRPVYDENYNTVLGYQKENYTNGIGWFCAVLVVLCVFVPVHIFRFKMNKRGVDALYSLPVKREKLYLAKTLVGLILVAVPFTACYIAGVGVVAVRENYFYFGWYFPAYFALLGTGVCLFGIYAFLFTRGNTVADGLVFMFAWTFLTELFAVRLANGFELLGFEKLAEVFHDSNYFDLDYMLVGGPIHIAEEFSRLLNDGSSKYLVWQVVVACVAFGALGYALLFTLLKKDKAENAEQISSSWWGYKTIVPAYAVLVLASFDMVDSALIVVVVTLIAEVVAYIAYRRKVKLRWTDWAAIGGSIAAGVLLGILLHP